MQEQEKNPDSFRQQSMEIFVSLLFFFAVLVTLIVKRPKEANQPPSPPRIPVIGNLHQLRALPHRSFQILSQKYGPLMLLHLGSVPTLIVSSADVAEKILKTHDLVFASRSKSKAADRLFYGSGDISFAPYGKYWREMRKICVVELLSVKRVQSFTVIVKEEVANMVKELSGSCSTTAVNLSQMLLSLSSGIISRVAFGKKYIGVGERGEDRLANLTKELAELLGAFSIGDYFPWLGWMDVLTGLNAKLNRNSRGLDTILNQVIDDHLSHRSTVGDIKEEDFVDVLLHIQKDSAEEFSLTRDNIKGIILDMYSGGTETTTATLEWAITELVKNPHVMKRAQAEVRTVVGRKQMVEEGHLFQMDYLKSIIKETLRLHPPGPLLIPRESTASVTIQGYHIPPKTRVLINVWAIARDPKSWEKADEFFPERFTESSIDFRGQDFQFIPFGAGRRSCPGMSFAISAIELALANLLHWFDWDLPTDINKEDLDMSEALGLSMHKKSALYLVPKNHFS